MKKNKFTSLILSILFVFTVNLMKAQIIEPNEEAVLGRTIVLKDLSLLYLNSRLYKFENYIYFKDDGIQYKLSIDSISKIDDVRVIEIKSDKLTYSLDKFAKTSRTGIGFQIVGGLLGYVLPFVIFPVPPIAFIATGVISVTGFIIWVTSYKHLRRYTMIAEAKVLPNDFIQK